MASKSGQTLRKPGFSQRSEPGKIISKLGSANTDAGGTAPSSYTPDERSKSLHDPGLHDGIGKVRDGLAARSTPTNIVRSIHSQGDVPPMSTAARSGRAQSTNKAKTHAEAFKPNLSTLPLPTGLSRSSSVKVPRNPTPREQATKQGLSRASSTVIPRTRSGITRKTILSSSDRQVHDDELDRARGQHQREWSSSPDDSLLQARDRSRHETTQRSSEKHVPVAKRQPTTVRPQFSTYQQHFSPKKPDGPAPSSRGISATSKLSDNPSHLSALQDELLQLQWLYHKTRGVSKEWAESARKKLGQRQVRLEEEAGRVARIENDQQQRVNVDGLKKWSVDSGGHMEPSKIKTLDRCIRRLTEMTRSHGKYADVIAQFEGWFEQATVILKERSVQPEKGAGGGISLLGQSWLDALPTLMHTLESCLADLGAIEPRGIGASTGLSAVWTAHHSLARGMISNLRTMDEVYSSLLQVDEQWIRGSIATVVDAGLESSSGRPQRRPAWD